MKDCRSIRFPVIPCVLALAFGIFPQALQAQWKAAVGAQRADKGSRPWHFSPMKSGFTPATTSPGLSTRTTFTQ